MLLGAGPRGRSSLEGTEGRILIGSRSDVLHLYRGDASSSARIQMEMNWLKGEVVDVNSSQFLRVALRRAFRRAGITIFHGQSTLPYMILVVLLRFFCGKGQRIVYDMHDLNEPPLKRSFRALLRYRLFYVCEYLVSRFGIEVITVSKGLARIFRRRFGVSPRVVYNVAFEVDRDRGQARDGLALAQRAGVVYFGLIKPDRIPLKWVSEVCSAQKEGVFDVYGRVPKGDFATYSAALEGLAAQTSLRLCGPYRPEAMGFLEKYRYSWLCFDSDRLNIRYCMPNKLFQSLSAGLCCVISDRLVEARTLFGDACVSYRDFLRICDGKLESPADKIDWQDVETRMQKVADRSRAVFLEACGVERSCEQGMVVDGR